MKGVRRWLVNTLGIVEIGTDNSIQKVSPEMAQLYVIGGVQVPSIGTVLNRRYRIDQLIGRGGIAVVYRGYDLEVHHTIAIKVLILDKLYNNKRDRDSEIERCLRNEARAVMSLSHPFITRVYNYERHKPWEYLIMEFVSGQNLHVLSRARPSGRLELKETIHIGLDVLDALSLAHKQGVIHNDITPRNILVNQHNEIKLCDFGLSTLSDLQVKRSAVTQPNSKKSNLPKHSTMGTVAYMSPERIHDRPVDARSDLYSLAATLYTLASGQPPFGTHLKDVIKGQSTQTLSAASTLPKSYEAILLKAMKSDPNERFSNTKEMEDALLETLHDLPAPFLSQNAVTRPISKRKTLSVLESETNPKIGKPQSQSREKQPLASVKTRSTSYIKASQLPINDKKNVIKEEKKPLLDMAWISPRGFNYEKNYFEVNGFYMDLTPVTNSQYAEFVQAQGQIAPSWWLGTSPPADKWNHPVVGVNFEQARRYAMWRGKRLPTTLEWIAVVRSNPDQPFPWGNTPEEGSCHCPRKIPSDTSPVTEHPIGASNEGCMDMFGNVWEWTDLDPRFPPPDTESFFVMGGSYRHPCKADEGSIPRSTVGKFGDYLYLGFRCARDKE